MVDEDGDRPLGRQQVGCVVDRVLQVGGASAQPGDVVGRFRLGSWTHEYTVHMGDRPGSIGTGLFGPQGFLAGLLDELVEVGPLQNGAGRPADARLAVVLAGGPQFANLFR